MSLDNAIAALADPKYSPDCAKCEDIGYIDERMCECEHNRLYKQIYHYYGFSDYDYRPNQAAIKNATGGVYVWGDTNAGKTTAIKIKLRNIKKSNLFKTIRMTDAMELTQLWYESYKDDRSSAMYRLGEIESAPILFIDDIDKIKMTEPRQEAFFSLFDKLRKYNSTVYITSNISVKAFIEKMPMQYPGGHPIETRIRDLCDEVKV